MDATLGLEEDQVTSLLVALSGTTRTASTVYDSPTVMDFPLQKAISDALEAPHGRKKQGGDILDVYNALSHDFLYKDLLNILIFLSNHDVARVADTFGRDPRKMKIAYTLLATLRGIPQLFYGDEMMFATGNPKRDDGRLRMDFPGGWAGDRVNLFTPEGREKARADTAYTHAADLYNYASTLFRWRRDKEVIHSGKTLHFLPQNNTYGYFRYNDTDVVFVFVNNSPEACKVPWTRYQEMTESLLYPGCFRRTRSRLALVTVTLSRLTVVV